MGEVVPPGAGLQVHELAHPLIWRLPRITKFSSGRALDSATPHTKIPAVTHGTPQQAALPECELRTAPLLTSPATRIPALSEQSGSVRQQSLVAGVILPPGRFLPALQQLLGRFAPIGTAVCAHIGPTFERAAGLGSWRMHPDTLGAATNDWDGHQQRRPGYRSRRDARPSVAVMPSLGHGSHPDAAERTRTSTGLRHRHLKPARLPIPPQPRSVAR